MLAFMCASIVPFSIQFASQLNKEETIYPDLSVSSDGVNQLLTDVWLKHIACCTLVLYLIYTTPLVSAALQIPYYKSLL